MTQFIWSALDRSPQLVLMLRALLPLAMTLLAFEAGTVLQRRFRGAALANPVLIAVSIMSAAVATSGISVTEYLDTMRPLTLLLGPATVALAVPLYRSLPRIRQSFVPVVIGVGVGVSIASISVVVIAGAFGADSGLLRSIASKSVTAAISMAVAEGIGGDPALAAGLTVLTGIGGAVICTWVFDLAHIRDPRARGIATGVAAHGIGTARMLAIDAEAGAFASLAMGLAGLAAGIGIPLAAQWFDALHL